MSQRNNKNARACFALLVFYLILVCDRMCAPKSETIKKLTEIADDEERYQKVEETLKKLKDAKENATSNATFLSNKMQEVKRIAALADLRDALQVYNSKLAKLQRELDTAKFQSQLEQVKHTTKSLSL